MSVLNEWDIVKELGSGILIYPFKGINSSLSGGCLKLTASEQAYIIQSEQRCSKQEDGSCNHDDIKNLKKQSPFLKKKILFWRSHLNKLLLYGLMNQLDLMVIFVGLFIQK